MKDLYSNKVVNKDFYEEVTVTSASTSQNIVYLPYKIVVTHVSVTDANGTRTIRQVSRWVLFKLWLSKVSYMVKNLKFKQTKYHEN